MHKIYKCGLYGKYNSSFEDYANQSIGIKRLGVLRADVDNLGYLFKNGLRIKSSNEDENKNATKLMTLSRYTMLSNKLSEFFKLYINDICKDMKTYIGKYSLSDKEIKGNIQIIYSGGDDIFFIGAWDEIIEIAIVLDDLLKKYTCNKITLSAGIGLVNPKMPISNVADFVGKLEHISKEQDGKNSITLLNDDFKNSFSFTEFKNDVIGKIKQLEEMCTYSNNNNEPTKVFISSGFLYRLLSLYEEKVNNNKVKLAYALGRLQNNENNMGNTEKLKKYLFDMMERNEKKEINQLVMALKLIIYMNRSDE